jgi:hypothetical protein
VREKVVADLTRLHAYRSLQDNAEQYASKAASEGIEALAESLGEGFAVQRIERFSRRRLNRRGSPRPSVPDLPIVGRSEQFVDGAFELADAVRQAGGVEGVAAAERTGPVAVDRDMTVYITQITDYQPVYAHEYEQLRPQVMQFVLQTDMISANMEVVSPFTLEAITQRVDFQRAEGAGDDASAPDDEPAPRADGNSA